MPNWELISTPPSSLDNSIDFAEDLYFDYSIGVIDANMFYGMLNVFFDMACIDINE